MVRRGYALLCVALALVTMPIAAGCFKTKTSIIAPAQPKTFLYVTNSEFLDAVVYVLSGGQRIRLGTANSNRTTTFEIPSHMIFGATSLSFVADPIGGRARQSTGDFVIDPGDEVELHLESGRLLLTKR